MYRTRSIPVLIALWAAAAALLLAPRISSGFAVWYAKTVYPVCAAVIARISGLLPFSLFEWLLAAALVYAVLWLLFGFARLCLRRMGVRELLAVMVQHLLGFLGVLLILYQLFCGINYYRPAFSEEEGFVIAEYSEEELASLCTKLVAQINGTAVLLDLDSEGRTTVPATLLEDTDAAMYSLAQLYPTLAGYYPQAKPVFFSNFLSVQNVTGIYSPFTIEANYNRDVPAYNLGHTICHELSHLRGFMREDEANFIGCLACENAEEPYLRYSGYMAAYIYAGNALAAQDMALYAQIASGLCQTAQTDLSYNSSFWARYQGVAAEAHEQLNDTYLKANNQTDGVRSYGRAVDLLLAYERLQNAGR